MDAAVNIDAPGNSDATSIDGPPATGWVQLFSSPEFDVANALAADASGNVYVTGFFSGNAMLAGQTVASGGNTDAFVAKMSPTGQRLWVRRYGGTGLDSGLAIATRTGGVVVAGSFSGTADFGMGAVTSSGRADGFVLALDADGNTSWFTHGGGGAGDTQFKSIAVDASQNVIVAGEFANTVNVGGANLIAVGANDFLVAKYTSGGAHVWSKGIGGAGGEISVGAVVVPGGDVVASAVFNGTVSNAGGSPLVSAGSNDVFAVRLLATTGAHVWSNRFGGANSDNAKQIAATATGFALVGCFTGSSSFGGTALTSAGAFDGFVAAFDANGNGAWSVPVGGASSECAQAASVKPTGNLLVTGSQAGSMVVGSTTLTSAGSEDIWLVEFAGNNGAVLTARNGGGTASDSPTAITAIGTSFALAGNSLGAADMFGQPIVTGGMMDGFAVQSLQ